MPDGLDPAVGQRDLAGKPLTGQVALVTGASRGIGRAFAVALARMGADIVAAARTTTPHRELYGTIHTTAAEVTELGGRCLAVEADMSRASDIESLVTEAAEAFGGVDILVNNAAAMNARMFDTFWDMTPESWRYQVDVNLTSYWLATKGVAPYMRERGRGLVVNMTSAGTGRAPDPRVVREGAHVGAAYVATKAAVNRMTVALAGDLRADGIAVVAIHPGHTRTENAVNIGDSSGFDMRQGHDVDVPVATLTHVVMGDPMRFTGEVLYAPEFVAEHGMLLP